MFELCAGENGVHHADAARVVECDLERKARRQPWLLYIELAEQCGESIQLARHESRHGVASNGQVKLDDAGPPNDRNAGCVKLTSAVIAGTDVGREQTLERGDVALRETEQERTEGGVRDETFETLRAYFSERQIVEITWLQAFVTYLNRMAVPLGIGSDGFCALRSRG